jgi:zinc carboxypeptidase
VTRWTTPIDGYVQVRLNGDELNDWDLALFDAKTGHRLDASLAWGANEVTQAWVRRGQVLTVQACRLSGPSAIEPLSITPVAITVPRTPVKTPKQSLVAIPIASEIDFGVLDGLGLNLDEVPNGHKAIAVLNGPADGAKIRKAGYGYTTLIPDMAAAERGYRAKEHLAVRAAAKSPLPSGRTTYRHYPDIQADLKKIVATHPNLARPVTLPVKTFQGRDIQGIEVTSNVKSKTDGKPIFWLMGEHHAREWPSAEIPTEFALYITSKFGKNKRVTNLLKRVRIIITPVINVDGYLVSREAKDAADISGDPAQGPSLVESVAPPGGSLAYRRKNCDGASPDPTTPCNLQYGVDNNRNYGNGWGGSGAGTDPNDQDYRGTDMWSEPENRAVWHFSQKHDITSLITMHNFASLVLRPPGRHNDGLAPDEIALKKLGDRMARDTGYTSEYGYQLYDTSGTTEDWNYAAAGTFGYTIEMGPDTAHGGNFHIEYQRAVIDQWTGAETLDGKGRGLRDALLAAGEAAADRQQFPTLKGTAPGGVRLRLRKDFSTFSSQICTVEDTDVPCTAQGALPPRSRADFLDYTTIVPRSGRFSWIVTPSTRPFVLKAGRTERWKLTCENAKSRKVLETRRITVDRGQTLVLDLGCGRKRKSGGHHHRHKHGQGEE